VLGGGPLGMAAHAGTTSFTDFRSDQRVYVDVCALPNGLGRGELDGVSCDLWSATGDQRR
jgi:hypothetical protein